jgi:hypothetical protein
LQARHLEGIEKPFELIDFLEMVEEKLSEQEETIRISVVRKPGECSCD